MSTSTNIQFTVVIVVTIVDRVLGVIVDSVSDVLTLRSGDIRPAPKIGTGLDTIYLVRLAIANDRMLIFIGIVGLTKSTAASLTKKLATLVEPITTR